MIEQSKSDATARQISALERELAARRSAEDMMIHDVRNPLSSMISIADMLSSRATNEDDKLWLNRMTALGHRALGILKATAGYAQMESKTYEPEVSDFDLLARLTVVLNELSALRDSRSVTLSYHYDGGPVAKNSYLVRGDRFFLEQLFRNLITIVTEASFPQSELSINVQSGRPLRVTIHSQEATPLLSHDNIFDRLAAYTSKRKGDAEAYVAQLVAKQHGGSVHYTTTEPKGITFTVSLPIAAPIHTSNTP